MMVKSQFARHLISATHLIKILKKINKFLIKLKYYLKYTLRNQYLL